MCTILKDTRDRRMGATEQVSRYIMEKVSFRSATTRVLSTIIHHDVDTIIIVIIKYFVTILSD